MDNDFEKDENGFTDEDSQTPEISDIQQNVEEGNSNSKDESEESTEDNNADDGLVGKPYKEPKTEDEYISAENSDEEDAVVKEQAESGSDDYGNDESTKQEVKKSFFQKWKENELEKEKEKREKVEKSEQRMKEIRERRTAEMYADGREPNKFQKFLMAEGKYINYENKYTVVMFSTVIIGIIILILIIKGGYITKDKFGIGNESSRAIVYSAGNDLYCYDLKDDPVLISENLSAGGSATYSYVGNGTTVANDGKSVYFIDNVAADGTFNLNYFTASKSGTPSLISANVSDYEVSYEGDGAVYIVAGESGTDGTLYGYSKKANASYQIADGVGVGGTEYAISADGKKAIFAKTENSSISLNISDIDGSNLSTIDTDVAQYLVTEQGTKIYYIKTEGTENGTSIYNIYMYDMEKSKTQLIDENVIAVTLSSDENAVVYYKNSGNKVQAKDIINDDGDDSEATNELRKEIETYEFNDITCSLYRYENGDSVLVNDGIFTAMPTDPKGEYIAYTVPTGLDKIKINLSEISSVSDIDSMYYVQAMKANCDTYIYKLNDFNDFMEFDNSYVYSYENSGNNGQVACFVDYDSTKKQGKLVLSTYDDNGVKSYGELEDDVSSYDFMGDGSRMAYLRGVDDSGAGTLIYVESNVPDEVSDSAYYYEVSKDFNRRLFYLDNYDSSVLGGTFHYYQQGVDNVVDDGVYMFAYRNNNNALYMKNYDSATATGDLYYLEGKTAKLVAQGVSSVFDFYDASR